MNKSLAMSLLQKIDSLYERESHLRFSKIQIICFKVSFALLSFLVLLFVLASLGFIARIEVNGAYFFIALFGSVISVVYKFKHTYSALFLFIGVMLVSLVLASVLYDASWDGRAYHQIGIYYFANGWNPIYQKMADVQALSGFLSHEIWVEHYLKFAELTASCIYKVFGNIEIGKAINYILAFANLFYAVYVLSKLPNITLTRALFLALCLAFSPIVLVQISTYYLDGLMANALCIVFLAIIDIEISKAKSAYSVLILALLITASLKLTGVAYAGFIGILYLLYRIFFVGLRDSKALCISGLIVAVLIMLCNINPLFTNIADGKHPGYPLLGEKKIDIISGQQPQTFKDFNRFEKFFHSVFSKTYNGRDKTEYKIPFFKNNGDWNVGVDTRVAGFGHYFGGIIILCLLFCVIHYAQVKNRQVILFSTLLIGSVCINPEFWWARYAPQMYFVPFVLLAVSYSIEPKPFRSIFRILVCVLLMASTIAAFNSGLKAAKAYSTHIDSHLSQIKSVDSLYFDKSMEKSFAIKLQERGYAVKILTKEEYEAIKDDFSPIPHTLIPHSILWDAKF